MRKELLAIRSGSPHSGGDESLRQLTYQGTDGNGPQYGFAIESQGSAVGNYDPAAV
jgi:hypothetical protein